MNPRSWSIASGEGIPMQAVDGPVFFEIFLAKAPSDLGTGRQTELLRGFLLL
jgi:hypothetical protein